MAEMTCPKCGGSMRTYERNSVSIEQCADCRGIFLDRGELDRLIDAEGAYESRREASYAGDRDRDHDRGDRDRYRDDDRDRHRSDDDHKYGHKKKKHGFLSEFFDD